MRQDRRPWFRWKALAPLALFFAFLAVLWGLFADMVARRSLEEAATQVLGTQVDIGWLRIRERRAGVEIGEPLVPERSATIAQAVRQWQARLAGVRSQLEDEVRKKTGGLGGLIGMF